MIISKELEAALGAALAQARRRRHEYLCVEHLLYALLEDGHARDIVLHCGGNVERLKREIEDFFEQDLTKAPAGAERRPADAARSSGFMERAILHVKYSGKRKSTMATSWRDI